VSLQAHAEERLDALLHALADATRRRLLRRLAGGPAAVGELARPIAMTRVAVSKHLRVLEAAGLITRTVTGRVHRCALSDGAPRELEAWLREYRDFWDAQLQSLARYAERGTAPRRRERGR
jgi:DNA-binding transcriptional ArsR family regulator